MQNLLLVDSSNKNLSLIAYLECGILSEFYYDNSEDSDNFGNIYLGRVMNVMQSLSAYFVDYGGEKNGFLPFNSTLTTLKRDDMVIVQIQKSEKDLKGARLSCFVRLNGKYCTYLPFNSGRQQYEMRQSNHFFKSKDINVNQALADNDLQDLKEQWQNILKITAGIKKSMLLKQEIGLIHRLLRDRYRDKILEILVDGHNMYTNISNIIQKNKLIHEIKEYKHLIPIFERYNVAQDIRNLGSRTVPLTSGGSISIDQAEAMICIDINSSSCNIGTLEDTSYKVNLEAADEIVRQIKLRDLSGIIAIDFIDMKNSSHIHNLEKRMNDLFRNDRVITKIGKINEFGVLMISRQRSGTSLYNLSHTKCSNCLHVTEKSMHSNIFELLSSIRIALYSRNEEVIKVECNPKIGHYMLNYMREELCHLENGKRRIIVNYSNISNFTINPVGELKNTDRIQVIQEILPKKAFDHHSYTIFPQFYTTFMHGGQVCLVSH